MFKKTKEPVEWKCVSLLVSYCCGIPEAIDMPAVRHNWSVRKTRTIRNFFLELPTNFAGRVDDVNEVG